MKNLSAVVVATLLSSGMASAEDRGWKVIAEHEVDAKTPEDVLSILETESSSFAWLRQDHVNREIAGVKTDGVAALKIKVRELQWAGETTCLPEDPRLEAKLLSGSVQRVSGRSEGFEDVIINGDPCLNQ